MQQFGSHRLSGLRGCTRSLVPGLSLAVLVAAAGCGGSSAGSSTSLQEEEPEGSPAQAPRPADTGPTTCGVRADRDGDGVERTDRSACDALSEDERTFPANSQEDCDDDDPSRSRGEQYYTDRDGDGFGAPHQQSVWGCRGDVIEGFAPNARDCDDTNPEAHVLRYPDRDGDGHGGGEAACVSESDPGYARDGDCDDSDSSIFPSSEHEQPLDGVDSNCDGADYPILNGPSDNGPPSEPDPALVTIPPEVRCMGRGLSIIAVELIWDCGGGYKLHIGNRGDIPVDGASLEVTADPGIGEPQTMALPSIGPGEVSVISAGGGGGYFVRLVDPGAPGACRPLSTEAEIEAPFVDCFFDR